MLKKRFNLRILAAIVACLAVTAVFASCDKDGSDDDGGTTSGKIDPALIGGWIAGGATRLPNYNPKTGEYIQYANSYGFATNFESDGTFVDASYLTTQSGYTTTRIEMFTAAKYSVVGDKIMLTNRTYESVRNGVSSGKVSMEDAQFQYLIGTDSEGKYLIHNFGSDQQLNPNGDVLKYRKLL